MTVRWQFDNATIARVGVGPVVHDLTWTIEPGRTWAVVGPVAAGKTSVVEALQGKHQIAAGALHRPDIDPARAVAVVGFREDSWRFSYSRHYYQQRFNFIEPNDDRTLADFLGTAPDDLTDRLGLNGLFDRSLIQLSNGQMRRARLARALHRRPTLLVLDDPFCGLDAAGRADVSALLGGLVAAGQDVLLVCPADAVPPWVSDVLELTAGRVTWRGPRRDYRTPAVASKDVKPPSQPPGDVILDLKDVTVRYGDVAVLDRVTWAVRAGERWAVLGPNGSGKTTLLSLLCGDHPQAYSNAVTLFGQRRGTGESIWDIKRRVGLLSPELHLYFTEPLTAEQAAGTGFHDGLVAKRLTGGQRERLRMLFAEVAPAVPLDRPFARLSSGEQRLALLVRALVKEVPLLILDEPFQALDPATMARARSWLDRHLGPSQTLLFVTHHAAELPASVTHRLTLSAGRAEVLG